MSTKGGTLIYVNQRWNTNICQPKVEHYKKIYLVDDFNVDLMKTENDTQTSQFVDTITSNLFVPHITFPTRITATSSTLIDNIHSNS